MRISDHVHKSRNMNGIHVHSVLKHPSVNVQMLENGATGPTTTAVNHSEATASRISRLTQSHSAAAAFHHAA